MKCCFFGVVLSVYIYFFIRIVSFTTFGRCYFYHTEHASSVASMHTCFLQWRKSSISGTINICAHFQEYCTYFCVKNSCHMERCGAMYVLPVDNSTRTMIDYQFTNTALCRNVLPCLSSGSSKSILVTHNRSSTNLRSFFSKASRRSKKVNKIV